MYLNCHTYYSLRYGTLSPEELVTRAAQHGVTRMALTDINNVTAMPEFVQQCRQHGIRPVAGMELRCSDQLRYIVLARDPEGFRRLNAFLSQHHMEGTPLPHRFPVCEHTVAIYPFGNHTPEQPGTNEYIGIKAGELHRLPATVQHNNQDKLVAWHPVTFSSRADHDLHRHLRAIDRNILLSQLQNSHTASPGEVFLTPAQLKQQYTGFPHILYNTEKLLDQCSIDFSFNTLKNKKTFTGHPADDKALLRKLAMDGVEYRYGRQHQEAIRRVEHELHIIHQLGFSAYFLITWDIIRYSMSQGFHHVGRGSGANSIVAYCLRITDVDPIELNLYFERFINPRRSTPPDFDIDFSWRDRDQVIDYVFKRYGSRHTALLGTISTFHHRSAIRELGKVHGLTKAEIDRLAAREDTGGHHDRVTTHVLNMARRLQEFPNLRSIHAGGILIPEEPVCCYSALDMPPKGLPTVQWDMYTAETLGFEKIDILSQRGIGHINDCVKLIRANRGKETDIHQVGRIKEDRDAQTLLQTGETLGCFYVESPAMRSLLKKLRCTDYSGLVAASSIIRPGVSRSGMMEAYIYRSHHPEETKYLHPVMEEQLKETYGVMVYQEDVIRICHHFAGLNLAEADVLRRAMSGKYRSKKEMQRLIDRFFESCREKGHPENLIREVWRQIESFAGYAFSKAHSASFAIESFQSLYLKAHYPLEFITAVINNFGGFYRSEIYFHEARRHGANIEPPCVNNSDYLSTIRDNNIYIGFIHLHQMPQKLASQICEERSRNGQYRGLEDFAARTNITREALIILIRAGGLRFTGIPKSKLLWQAHLLTGKAKQPTPGLFRTPVRQFRWPEPETSPLSDAYDEIELLGFTTSLSPFDLLKTSFRGGIYASDMLRHTGRNVRMAGWLVSIKHVRTTRKETMFFGCFLDYRGNFFDTVHFPKEARTYPFRGHGIYLLKGNITESFGHPTLTIEKMARLPLKPDPREQ